MFNRNIFFTLASNSKDGALGLKPNNNKLEIKPNGVTQEMS